MDPPGPGCSGEHLQLIEDLMRTMTTVFVILFYLLIALPGNAERFPYLDADQVLTSDRAAALFENALRVVPLSDQSLLVINSSKRFEANAMVATLIGRDGQRQNFAATDWLPAAFVSPQTAGQIYSAAILDDGNTVAVSIGWTNASGRNINGIVVLDKSGQKWQPRNAIVMRGSVRDIAAGPANSIAAMTVTPDRTQAKARNDIVLLSTAGKILMQLQPWGKSDHNSAEAEERAIAARLQRVGNTDLAVFDLTGKVVTVFRLKIATHTPEPPPDGFFLYPQYRRPSSDPAERIRLLSFLPAPEQVQGFGPLKVEAVRLNADHSLTVVRQGLKGKSTTVFVSTYGRSEGMRTVRTDVLWKGIWLSEGVVGALQVDPEKALMVRARTP